jgi:hypothetical protein
MAMALIELDLKQYDPTVEALGFAFRSYDELKVMLRAELGQRLSNISAPDAMPIVLNRVIEKAEADGWLEALLMGAIKASPNNPKLRELGPVLLLTGGGEPTQQLQGLVLGNNAVQDVASWRAGIERIEKSVCRLQANNTRDNDKPFGAGTGFLIADDVLMTNCHVVDFLLQPGAAVPAAQFDFIANEDGTASAGEVIPLEGGKENWLLGSSPVNELDYALIKLPRGTGRPPQPTPKAYGFSAGDVYFIVQHPRGQPMKIGGGTMIGMTPSQLRINYTTNTESGSSGSPVFTTSWQPVALHCAGSNVHNSGVPLAAIYEHARANGYWPDGATPPA